MAAATALSTASSTGPEASSASSIRSSTVSSCSPRAAAISAVSGCAVQEPCVGQAEERGDFPELIHVRHRRAALPLADGLYSCLQDDISLVDLHKHSPSERRAPSGQSGAVDKVSQRAAGIRCLIYPPKWGPDMKSYQPHRKRPRKALKTGAFFTFNRNACTPIPGGTYHHRDPRSGTFLRGTAGSRLASIWACASFICWEIEGRIAWRSCSAYALSHSEKSRLESCSGKSS